MWSSSRVYSILGLFCSNTSKLPLAHIMKSYSICYHTYVDVTSCEG